MTVAEFWPVCGRRRPHAPAAARRCSSTSASGSTRVEPRFGDAAVVRHQAADGRSVASRAAGRRRRRRGDAQGDDPAAGDVHRRDRVGRGAGQSGERRAQAPPGPPTRRRSARARGRRASARVMLAAGDLRSATLVSVLAYAGLRPGEALGLELRHIRERRILDRAGRRARPAQDPEDRPDLPHRRPLGPAREDLAAWSSRSSPPWPRCSSARADGHPWRPTTGTTGATAASYRAAQAAGLGRPRPYDLRHSFASLLIREQRDLDRRARRPARPRADDDARHLLARLRRAPRRTKPIDVEHSIKRARHAAQVQAAAPKPVQDQTQTAAHSGTVGAA